MSSTGEVANRIDRALDDHRRNAIVFAVALVVMTPGLLAGGALVILVLFAQAVEPSMSARSALVLSDILALLFLTTLFRRRGTGKGRRVETVLAVVVCAAIVGVSAIDTTGIGGGILGVQVGLWFVFLSLLGRAYVPKESYYFGWGPYAADDPFTFRDDADRMHAGLGFAVLIPHFVLLAYGELLTSSWLWKRPDLPLDEAAEALIAAARSKVPLDKERFERDAVAALVRLELARVTPRGLEATLDGKDLVGRG